MTQYKRKFMVPGNTIRTCRSFRKKCEKTYRRTGRTEDLPCSVLNAPDSNFYRRDKSRCPFPINKPNSYIVSETMSGEWQCSCPHWKFRREECSHIRKAQASPEEYEIAVEFTGKLTDVFTKAFKT